MQTSRLSRSSIQFLSSPHYLEMPEGFSIDKRIAGIYGAGFFVLATIYFFLFMISASQTPGMKQRQSDRRVTRKVPRSILCSACMRGFGYLISILPLMLGFVWAVIDPEHLTWADKVSGTYVKKNLRSLTIEVAWKISRSSRSWRICARRWPMLIIRRVIQHQPNGFIFQTRSAEAAGVQDCRGAAEPGRSIAPKHGRRWKLREWTS